MKILLSVLLALLPIVVVAQEATTPDAAGDVDQQAILKAAESYQAAFNSNDAVAVAKHFSEDAELTTATGTIKGRAAIEADYVELFKGDSPHISLVDVNVDVIAPSVAIETGVAVLANGDTSQEIPYRAVHVKTSDGWRLDRVQDETLPELPPSNYDKLAPLEWLVGTWALESEESTTTVSCRWTTNQNFLLQSYSVVNDDGSALEGTQVIGWDPIRNRIRSWLFDSDGGFGSGVWSGEGDRWTVQTLQVVPDGKEASSTNIYTRVDDTRFKFSSVGRQVGGKLLQNISAAQFTRQ